jgi:hypothetical protein
MAADGPPGVDLGNPTLLVPSVLNTTMPTPVCEPGLDVRSLIRISCGRLRGNATPRHAVHPAAVTKQLVLLLV